MTKQVSPPELLKTVKCVCQTDCTRKSCTCRQYGVVSTNIFSGCMGMSCMICEPLNDTDSRQKNLILSNFYPLLNQMTSNRF